MNKSRHCGENLSGVFIVALNKVLLIVGRCWDDFFSMAYPLRFLSTVGNSREKGGLNLPAKDMVWYRNDRMDCFICSLCFTRNRG